MAHEIDALHKSILTNNGCMQLLELLVAEDQFVWWPVGSCHFC